MCDEAHLEQLLGMGRCDNEGLIDMEIAVLGAGISGLSIARMLADIGAGVTVYEKEKTIGGLARTRFVDGYLYDPYGGHVFNSKHPEVLEWAFGLLERKQWKYTARNAKIYYDGRYVSYPFELSLCELGTEDAVDCIYDYMMSQQGDRPDNFQDWIIWNFGRAIAERYMLPYNEKIWNYSLRDMETEWMEGKMPLPAKKEIIRSILLKDSTERKMPHSAFYYPIEGGIQRFVDCIADGLSILNNTAVKSIRASGNEWVINESAKYDYVISTIPLPELPQMMDLPGSIYDSISNLKYNSLTTVLFKCPPTDITWLYIPSRDYQSHRVGYQSTLTPNASPQKNEGVAALEIIGNRFDINAINSYSKVLPDELGYTEALDYDWTKYAYVVFDANYRKNITNVLSYFNTLCGIELLGRWGQWNYNNMDLCILDAMRLCRRLEKELL